MPEHRFHTPEPAELEIKIPIGEIEVETIDGDESTITIEGSEKILELTEVRQEGRRLVVELKGKKPFGITISIGDLSWGSGGRLTVHARVPHGSDAILNTAAADMKLRGRVQSLESKSASGDLIVRGDIEIGVEAGTNLDVDAGSVSGDLSSEVPLGSDPGSAEGYGPTLVVRGKTVSGDFRVFRAS